MIIPATALLAGSGARIDVHSRSRTGRIDRGVNAKRIRTDLAAVAQHAAGK